MNGLIGLSLNYELTLGFLYMGSNPYSRRVVVLYKGVHWNPTTILLQENA